MGTGVTFSIAKQSKKADDIECPTDSYIEMRFRLDGEMPRLPATIS
ncbi:hypothetical protein HMPREF1990_00272 [Porphyromonas gingivalis W4087]|nr:hypothetical protein HMPREF1554_01963 [Porphyromonas gingivalis F0569]ERJ88548.1 hypothetical protein HMPREF1989_00304 [Porphyromonas gingivalis F0566]ERJ91110.1 hypothetical protein HMPREF1990_00272 [Porphyromonas gingivalis W4087]